MHCRSLALACPFLSAQFTNCLNKLLQIVEHFKNASVLFNCSMNSVQDQRVRKATKATQPRLASRLCLCLCLRLGCSVVHALATWAKTNTAGTRRGRTNERTTTTRTKRNRGNSSNNNWFYKTTTRTLVHVHTSKSKFKIKTKNSWCAGCTTMCERQRANEHSTLWERRNLCSGQGGGERQRSMRRASASTRAPCIMDGYRFFMCEHYVSFYYMFICAFSKLQLCCHLILLDCSIVCWYFFGKEATKTSCK